MFICTLVYPCTLCTLCTSRHLSYADVHLYLGVPSYLMYLVYLKTFVLCRCSSVPRCTLVPYVPCVPQDICPMHMFVCTLVYPRTLCTLCTSRHLSYADVHLYLGVPSYLMYLVYLERFVLCTCPSVPRCTLVSCVPFVPQDICPMQMSICTSVYPCTLCTLVYPCTLCTSCTSRHLSYADVYLYLGVPSYLVYLAYLERFVLCTCPSVPRCTLVSCVPCVPQDICPLPMSICTSVYPRTLCTLCTLRDLCYAHVCLYLGVPMYLMYLVYLKTFVLCRCSSVPRCTLVPYVPCVPQDICPMHMFVCTLVYPRTLCTLCTSRHLSYADVHLYLGVPSYLMYLVYLERFVLCTCPSVPRCTLVSCVPCVPQDICPMQMSICTSVYPCTLCTLVYPCTLCTLCTLRDLCYAHVHLYLGVPSYLVYLVYLKTFVLCRCPSVPPCTLVPYVPWCTLVPYVPLVPQDICPMQMFICTLVYPRILCTLRTLRDLCYAHVHLYLGVPSYLVYLVYLKTFVLCRCPSVPRCTLVPCVPCVP